MFTYYNLQLIENLHSKMGCASPEVRSTYLHAIEDIIEDLTEVELDELSKSTLGSYIKKGSENVAYNTVQAAVRHAHGDEEAEKYNEKVKKRIKGIGKAADKLAKEETETIDELSKSTLKSYIGKKLDSVPTDKKPMKLHKKSIEVASKKIAKKSGDLKKNWKKHRDDTYSHHVVNTKFKGKRPPADEAGTIGGPRDHFDYHKKRLLKNKS